ncbi:hypothetical protein GCM10007939_09460 [Amylibacter marinus]|uniref:Uncharacterized protein n=1 Tax=Amylibacter marinus TaxID=1475483 RepID=A0ABQ5VU74_9RHOB|nr:DUF6476 family protein [Amylibacter marinus]GLQ34663.1 hypothetical protein GCM10007939_09460 [Amylibacter marinus]
MNDTLETPVEPANLRFLRRLVTLLLIVMILGFITLIALFVMRFSAETERKPLTSITLPAGVTASAYTRGGDWYAIVTADNQILIYNQSDQSLRQSIQIEPK